MRSKINEFVERLAAPVTISRCERIVLSCDVFPSVNPVFRSVLRFYTYDTRASRSIFVPPIVPSLEMFAMHISTLHDPIDQRRYKTMT